MGEEAAARYLMFQGYSIRSRNWRVGHLEVDIVAEKRGVLVFVEVKTRADDRWGEPQDAVDDEKRRFLVQAANAYLHCYNLEMQVRYDIVAVTGWQPPFEIRHIENAFRHIPKTYV